MTYQKVIFFVLCTKQKKDLVVICMDNNKSFKLSEIMHRPPDEDGAHMLRKSMGPIDSGSRDVTSGIRAKTRRVWRNVGSYHPG